MPSSDQHKIYLQQVNGDLLHGYTIRFTSRVDDVEPTTVGTAYLPDLGQLNTGMGARINDGKKQLDLRFVERNGVKGLYVETLNSSGVFCTVDWTKWHEYTIVLEDMLILIWSRLIEPGPGPEPTPYPYYYEYEYGYSEPVTPGDGCAVPIEILWEFLPDATDVGSNTIAVGSFDDIKNVSRWGTLNYLIPHFDKGIIVKFDPDKLLDEQLVAQRSYLEFEVPVTEGGGDLDIQYTDERTTLGRKLSIVDYPYASQLFYGSTEIEMKNSELIEVTFTGHVESPLDTTKNFFGIWCSLEETWAWLVFRSKEIGGVPTLGIQGIGSYDHFYVIDTAEEHKYTLRLYLNHKAEVYVDDNPFPVLSEKFENLPSNIPDLFSYGMVVGTQDESVDVYISDFGLATTRLWYNDDLTVGWDASDGLPIEVDRIKSQDQITDSFRIPTWNIKRNPSTLMKINETLDLTLGQFTPQAAPFDILPNGLMFYRFGKSLPKNMQTKANFGIIGEFKLTQIETISTPADFALMYIAENPTVSYDLARVAYVGLSLVGVDLEPHISVLANSGRVSTPFKWDDGRFHIYRAVFQQFGELSIFVDNQTIPILTVPREELLLISSPRAVFDRTLCDFSDDEKSMEIGFGLWGAPNPHIKAEWKNFKVTSIDSNYSMALGEEEVRLYNHGSGIAPLERSNVPTPHRKVAVQAKFDAHSSRILESFREEMELPWSKFQRWNSYNSGFGIVLSDLVKQVVLTDLNCGVYYDGTEIDSDKHTINEVGSSITYELSDLRGLEITNSLTLGNNLEILTKNPISEVSFTPGTSWVFDLGFYLTGEATGFTPGFFDGFVHLGFNFLTDGSKVIQVINIGNNNEVIAQYTADWGTFTPIDNYSAPIHSLQLARYGDKMFVRFDDISLGSFNYSSLTRINPRLIGSQPNLYRNPVPFTQIKVLSGEEETIYIRHLDWAGDKRIGVLMSSSTFKNSTTPFEFMSNFFTVPVDTSTLHFYTAEVDKIRDSFKLWIDNETPSIETKYSFVASRPAMTSQVFGGIPVPLGIDTMIGNFGQQEGVFVISNLIVTDFNATETEPFIAKYVKLKAVLRTNYSDRSPVLESYRIKLGG